MDVRPTPREPATLVDHHGCGVPIHDQADQFGSCSGAATAYAGPFVAHPATLADRGPGKRGS